MSSESDRRKPPYVWNMPRFGERDLEPLMTVFREALARKRERMTHGSVRLKDYSEMTPEQIAAREAWFDQRGRWGDPAHEARMERNVNVPLAMWREHQAKGLPLREISDDDEHYWQYR